MRQREKGGAFRVGNANPGGSRVEEDATDAVKLVESGTGREAEREPFELDARAGVMYAARCADREAEYQVKHPNVFEAPFATVRLREHATRTKGLMAFKLLDMAEQRSVAPASYRWSVRVKFVDGVRLHPAKPVTQSTDNHHSFFSAKNSSSPPREGGWKPVSLHSAACLVHGVGVGVGV